MLVRLMLVAVLVTRRVLVRETGQVMDVQSMGQEPRPGLGETRADPPPPEPDNPLQATAANRAGLPEGAAIARRQNLRREAAATIDISGAAHFAPSPAGAG